MLPDGVIFIGLFAFIVCGAFLCYQLGRHNLANEIGLTREEYERRTKGESGI